MIIGVTHDHDGRVVQRLSVSTRSPSGYHPMETATVPSSSTTSFSCGGRSRPIGSGGKSIRN